MIGLAVLALLYPNIRKEPVPVAPVVRFAPPVTTAAMPRSLPTPSPCTDTSPCSLTRGPDGETEHVTIAYGQRVCFDPELFWNNLSRLVPMSSYLGRTPQRFSCTQEQVQTHQCRMYVADQFWFRPADPEVELPPYWFRDENGDRSCDRPGVTPIQYNEETEE